MRAMILAAGAGKRMGVLTENTHKALLQVNGKPLIFRQIERLVQAGLTDIVINVSHFHALLKAALGDGSQFGANIFYSVEQTPLETGGGIAKALSQLGNDPFVVTSCDLVTDYPFERLSTLSVKTAHLVLVDNPPFHPKGDYALKNDHVCLSGAPLFNYAGIGVFHPSLFTNAPGQCFPLTACLNPAIRQQSVTGEYYGGPWHNIGTPAELAACNAEKTA